MPVMVVLALIGALTVGVFVGCSIRRRQDYETITKQDLMIVELEKLVNIYRANTDAHERRYSEVKQVLLDLGFDLDTMRPVVSKEAH